METVAFDANFAAFCSELKKFCIERIKLEDWAVLAAQVAPGGQAAVKKAETVGRQLNQAPKAAKTAIPAPDKQQSPSAAESYKTDIKTRGVKAVVLVVDRLRSAVKSFSDAFNRKIDRLEAITQNTFKSEASLVKTIVAQMAQSIESETKVEHAVQVSKFKLTVDKDNTNFTIAKPKLLFNLEAVNWTWAKQ